MNQLVLASTSPRRRELLESAGVSFEILSPPGEEALPEKGERPAAYAQRAAHQKALRAAKLPEASGKWILCADTVVALGGEVLGKPKDAEDAFRMLRKLSGKTHEVFSAFVLLAPDGKVFRKEWSKTEVDFGKIADERLRAYAACGEPLDKAGGYAIQGKGSFLIKAIRGSYTNVVGLPLAETLDALEAAGISANGSSSP